MPEDLLLKILDNTQFPSNDYGREPYPDCSRLRSEILDTYQFVAPSFDDDVYDYVSDFEEE